MSKSRPFERRCVVVSLCALLACAPPVAPEAPREASQQDAPPLPAPGVGAAPSVTASSSEHDATPALTGSVHLLGPRPPSVDLRYGDAGVEVARLQFCLKLVTDSRMDEDGKFGPKTRQLLNLYQRAISVPESDQVDSALRGRLGVDAAAVAAALSRESTQARLGVPPLEELAWNVSTVAVVPGEGDKRAYYAAGERWGFAYGDGAEAFGVNQGSFGHLEWLVSDELSPSVLRVFAAISRNEGPFDAVNSYDGGYYTWGAYQLIGAYRAYDYRPQSDELAQGLALQRALDPVSFSERFQRYGYDVAFELDADGVLEQASVKMTLVRPSGEVLRGKDVWITTGTEERLNQIFINAGRDPRIQRTHVLSAYAIHFDALDLPIASGAPTPRALFRSERLVAGFLDMELNRGRNGARTTFWAAVQAVAARRGLQANAPDTWGERDAVEREIFDEALARITHERYAERLRRTGNSVFVSDKAGSYVE